MSRTISFHVVPIMVTAALVVLVQAEDEDRAVRATMRMAVIGEFEEKAENAEDENSRRSAEAMVSVLFRELKTDFELKDLNDYNLLRVGDYLRANTAVPRDALPYYEEALGRPDPSYRFHALQGRAEVYGLSPEAADIDKAIKDFTRILEDSEEKARREFALFRMIELYMRTEDYEKAADQARIYLDREKSGFFKYAPKVSLMLAQSFDKRGMRDDAIAMYVKIWAVHMGNVMVSAPAITRWMELLWERNKPGDRQAAHENGARYIELTSRFKDKLTGDELAMWEGVVKVIQAFEAEEALLRLAQ